MSITQKNRILRIIFFLVVAIFFTIAKELGLPLIIISIICGGLMFFILKADFLKETHSSNKNRNVHRWISSANKDEQKEFMINYFFLPDNIDFDKYLRNQYANNILNQYKSLDVYKPYLSVGNNTQPPPNPTPTFKNDLSNYLDRALGVPDWMYIAYPDVLVWFWNNSNTLGFLKTKYSSDEISSDSFFRELIDIYKQKYQLECSL